MTDGHVGIYPIFSGGSFPSATIEFYSVRSELDYNGIVQSDADTVGRLDKISVVANFAFAPRIPKGFRLFVTPNCIIARSRNCKSVH
ncbi:MAG: hypothetical protein ACYTEX_27370, partial [Planctomycetota bacterium]